MISVFEPDINFSDIWYVLKNLYNKNISGTSPVVMEFEETLAIKFKRKYALSVSSGSVALDLMLNLAGVNEDDEIILPSFTIISCLSAVIRVGAKPVFCDVDEKSWNMTLKNVKECVTENTKAILMVHTYGLTAEGIEISNFCKERGITLLEDAAEAHGQNISGKLCGSFGLISSLSFYANKHITTGEGGVVLTDSEEIYLKGLQMRNLDFTSKKRFQHNNLFWNYRMSGLQAALGLSQIKRIEKVIRDKKKQGESYNRVLKQYSKYIDLPKKNINTVENHFWVYGVVLKIDGIRDQVMERMFSKGIETRPFFWPLHKQDALPLPYKDKIVNLPTSENLGKNGLYLPLGKNITTKQIAYIAESLIGSIKESY